MSTNSNAPLTEPYAPFGPVRILIKGSAGFPGAQLSHQLVQHGQDVPCPDNFFTGHQTRGLCHLDDKVQGLTSLRESRDDPTGPVNLGSPGETSLQALAVKIIQFTGSSPTSTPLPLPADDPVQRTPDISPAQAGLDGNSPVELDQGWERAMAYFGKLLSQSAVA